MLTSITIDASTQIDVPIIGATIANKYIIKSISGLGPPDIDVVIGALATDGGVYQNRRVPQRNPVILMGFNPDYSTNETIDDLRDALYVAFLEPNPMSPQARVILHDSVKPDRFVNGYVEKLEISHFVKDPEVQISILCPDPYLKGDQASVVPDVADVISVNNPGTAPCGFQMEIQFTAPVSGFSLTRGAEVLMSIDYDFESGDILLLDTRMGSRLVRRQRAGLWLNIIDKITVSNKWPTIIPGNDVISLSTNQVTWISLDYIPQWWGV